MDIEQRAIRAQQLLEDPVLSEILDGIREASITAWLATKTDDQKQRDFSWLTVKVVDRIKGELQGAIDGHRLAMSNAVRAPQ